MLPPRSSLPRLPPRDRLACPSLDELWLARFRLAPDDRLAPELLAPELLAPELLAPELLAPDDLLAPPSPRLLALTAVLIRLSAAEEAAINVI